MAGQLALGGQEMKDEMGKKGQGKKLEGLIILKSCSCEPKRDGIIGTRLKSFSI